MTVLKLPHAGDSVTLEITGAEVVEGQYGTQVRFSAGEDDLYLPEASATRQLERLHLALEDTPGHILTFSRTPSKKPGANPYWNISVAGQHNGTAPVAAPAPVAVPRALPSWDALEAAYVHALKASHGTVGKLKGATVADVVAGAATLFIQAAKMGLVQASAPAPAPAPAPKPTRVTTAKQAQQTFDAPPPYDEVPAGLQDDDGDADLPF